jgi:hypothetical protein
MLHVQCMVGKFKAHTHRQMVRVDAQIRDLTEVTEAIRPNDELIATAIRLMLSLIVDLDFAD